MTPPQSAPRGEMFPKRPGTAQQELQPPTAPSHPAGASLGNVKTAGLPGDSSDTHPAGEAGGGGGGVRALPAGPYPALPTAQHSPTPHAPTAASRSPEQIRNRVTELLLRHPTVPPRGHHSVPPAHSTAPRIPFPPPLPKLTPSSRPPYLPLTPPHYWAARCPDPPMVTPTPGSQHGRHLLPCAVLSRADGKAKQTQTLSLHVAPDNGSPQTDLFRAN